MRRDHRASSPIVEVSVSHDRPCASVTSLRLFAGAPFARSLYRHSSSCIYLDLDRFDDIILDYSGTANERGRIDDVVATSRVLVHEAQKASSVFKPLALPIEDLNHYMQGANIPLQKTGLLQNFRFIKDPPADKFGYITIDQNDGTITMRTPPSLVFPPTQFVVQAEDSVGRRHTTPVLLSSSLGTISVELLAIFFTSVLQKLTARLFASDISTANLLCEYVPLALPVDPDDPFAFDVKSLQFGLGQFSSFAPQCNLTIFDEADSSSSTLRVETVFKQWSWIQDTSNPVWAHGLQIDPATGVISGRPLLKRVPFNDTNTETSYALPVGDVEIGFYGASSSVLVDIEDTQIGINVAGTWC